MTKFLGRSVCGLTNSAELADGTDDGFRPAAAYGKPKPKQRRLTAAAKVRARLCRSVAVRPAGGVLPGPGAVQVRRETKTTKSRAGRRAVPLPSPLAVMLRTHRDVQAQERKLAGNLWMES